MQVTWLLGKKPELVCRGQFRIQTVYSGLALVPDIGDFEDFDLQDIPYL